MKYFVFKNGSKIAIPEDNKIKYVGEEMREEHLQLMSQEFKNMAIEVFLDGVSWVQYIEEKE